MHIIVAMTGASGQLYALRLLQKLHVAQVHISLVISEPACVSLAAESDIKLNATSPDLTKLFGADGSSLNNVRYFSPRQISAPIASGSNPHDGMVVIPCSMGTLGRIAHGTSDDLIARAADVTLKERRKLILVARETPLSLIHLKNMQAVTEAGALVMPACPHFYHQPDTVEEVLDTVVDRVLDQLGVAIDTQRWNSGK
ncbi:MAG: UbiX family flavin prenyltransferase [Abitibacteriaceae bacterium]|nr:UbiX family flavin prenyltransferase [Abditibacteriaceae bacterium]